MKTILLLALLVACPSFAADRQGTNLRDLYEGHHWFGLRRALLLEDGSALYKGAAASAFGEKDRAETLLRSVIESEPHSDAAYQAHEWLTYLYIREGRYQDASSEIASKGAARPDRANSENEMAIMNMFGHLPNQSLEHFQPSRIRYAMKHHDMVVPLSINRHQVEFIVDTDANMSTISSAQARLLGMTMESSKAKQLGATGAETAFDIAVASRLQIGNIRLRDVAFVVMPNDGEPFKNIPLGTRGLIRLPVLPLSSNFTGSQRDRIKALWIWAMAIKSRQQCQTSVSTARILLRKWNTRGKNWR